MAPKKSRRSDQGLIADGGKKEETLVIENNTIKNNNDPLDDFLSFVKSDASMASFLWNSKNKKVSSTGNHHKQVLLNTCQHLFQHVESLSEALHKLQDDDTNNPKTASLSGLNELYLGEEAQADGEIVWGQVELQNAALFKIMKTTIRKLTKSAATAATDEEQSSLIRLLNLEGDLLNDDESEDDASESEEDEMTRRMRERMERTLDDMDSSDNSGKEEEEQDMDSEEDDDEPFEDTRFFGKKKNAKQQESTDKLDEMDEKDPFEGLLDPAAEELNNGFFDINEMEAFADEEEDMLPEQVWDPTPDDYDKKKSKKQQHKKSFHQRQREGIDGDDDSNDDNDEDDDDEYEEMMNSLQNVKRKKYRQDDEVEALFSMYKDTTVARGSDGGDDYYDDMDEAVNMTAADLFGAPNKKYFHKWKAQQEAKDKQQTAPSASRINKKKSSEYDDDEDSWDDYKFDEKDADWGGEEEEEEVYAKPKATAKDGGDNDGSSSSGGSSASGSESDDELDKKPKANNNNKTTTTSNNPKSAMKSQHARQSERLQQETERLEKEMLREKPWQMVGEATATARPVNSLLEGTPEFNVASKLAPVITEEHTSSLEEIIKRRILNEDWDDVIPRELPDVAWHKKRGELPEVSQEKAKLGLGELYEREYLKKAVGYDVDAAEKESEEDKAKNEMKQLFANIMSKLDALSNYHFAPRPVAEEAEVRPATTPAIAMEEVLPLHVSDARGAAPEEVYGKKRGREGILRGESELEQSERKRIRSAKKASRRKARKEKAADNKLIARVEPGLGLNNPYEKRKAQEEISMARAEGRITDGQSDARSGYGSSGKFFRQMQDEVSKTLRDGQPKDSLKSNLSTKSSKSSSFKM